MSSLTDLLTSQGIKMCPAGDCVSTNSQKTTLAIPLEQYRVLSIKGPDCWKFLQGQLTCDMDEVKNRGSSLGAHCNIKGHMLSLFRIMRIADDEVWLRMDASIFDTAVTNLKKYIVFSKAEACEITDQVTGLGLLGPGATAVIDKLFERVPSEDNGIISLNQGAVVRVPGDRFELWVTQDKLPDHLSNVPDRVGIGAIDAWQLSEINAGIPDLRPETQEAFIPQMTNLQALAGVSFRKGCYTGQEIVTRLQHRGQLKKSMYLVSTSSPQPPQPLQKVLTAEQQSCGQVVLAASDNDGQYRLLAVITKKAADQGELFLEDGSQLQLESLPYTLDPALFLPK
ncbi:YgfZ/GcvT domain-containing protein [Pontibacter sp. JAM-7]|uniref:CAF17-like 4Fe-4S cluster assembly/insertion protein YgfZ n=1 Tax=Pontibacter sp. JAM-7 TaxID=3366581 RepID=UPI003AF98D39